ncbi:MAG: hypothetical protein MRJ68_22395, partial [Nitrospira sp.]|nr:hypothetical protein [Nitrospira sp.]
VIGLGGTSGSLVAAFEYDSYESPRLGLRPTDKANWSDFTHESRKANRSGEEMSAHATSSEAERRSESHPSGNYFRGESSRNVFPNDTGHNHGADLNQMDGAGENPHFVYGGQPSSLGDPSVQELSR